MQTRTGRAPGGRAPEAILAATERLLRDRPLHELSVAEIIAAAGISRTSFYAHFDSKAAVIARCLHRVMDEITLAFEPVHATGSDALEGAIRSSLERWVQIGERHGALLRAVSEEWSTDPRLAELWVAMLGEIAGGAARLVEGALGDDVAQGGPDAAAVSGCLVWGFERVLQVALDGGAAGLPAPAAIVEPLTQVMLGGLFGRAPGRRI
ncbi:MAG: TetR/AcrR family transcriptional regulator [Solirubrobacteraceae bacterium]